ncbi:SDR family oxidoreductase [Flavivirga amylovorans]|uniref:SDR family oxidoreductase n=1 Tax=Flavivirga amylovorans TaxID=870486 RepID=A0ABT8WYQ1_9FLAO|nr:SDR family oxidoreductase [Flavivirga amylovorans]MDO5986470.1 SDR family oxidoreductase [Flavivirga amylovorans]
MKQSKIALVTGGSRGLGRDMAINISKKGIDVIITYKTNKESADKVVREIERHGQKAKAFQLDTSNTKVFEDFFNRVSSYLTSEYGSPNFDFIINNAGTGLNQLIIDTSEDQFDEMLNIHFKGVYFLTQKGLPYINDKGRIINISSGLTRFSFPGSSVYACMKGAVEVFTRYLAKELGSRKITSNVIAPGAIATDFGGGTNRDNQEKRQIIANITALGKVGEAEDIGGVVAFLCTEEAQWVNGQRIEVSGGMLL